MPHTAHIETRLIHMTLLSPSAKYIMETEGYRTSLETDSVEIEPVQQALFQALLEDLYEIGVEFHCPIGELYGNYYDLDRFLDVCDYLLPNTLYGKLRDDPGLRTILQNILNGSAIDDGDTTLAAWLKYLGLEDEHYGLTCRAGVENVLPYAHSADLFDTYLHALLAVDESTAGVTDIDPAQHAAFHAYVARFDERATQALEALVPVLPREVDPAVLQKRVRIYIQNLVRPDRDALHAWLFVPLDGQDSAYSAGLRANRLREFAAGSRLHPEHWKLRGTLLGTLEIAGFVVRMYAESADREAFAKAVAELFAAMAPDEKTPPVRYLTLFANQLKEIAP